MTGPANTTERAVARIRADTLSGTLKPGERLTQFALAERLGISRFPVWEALASPAQQGLVTANAGQGATVAPLSPDEIDELYSLRITLRRHWSPHIIHHISARDVDRFRSLVEEMEGCARSLAFKIDDLGISRSARCSKITPKSFA